MEYIDITLGRYADVPFFSSLKNNFEYFVQQMTAKGLISPLLPVELWDDVTYDMVLTEIQSLFNNVEKATYHIDTASDWINDYSFYVDYGDQSPIHWREWEKKQPNKYMLVMRWLDWMKYNYRIISGQEQKQQFLHSSTPSDGNVTISIFEQIYDEAGEPIRTLEGYF